MPKKKEEKIKTERIVICVEPMVKEIFDMMVKISNEKTHVRVMPYAILKEGLFHFLDEINCDFSIIDRDANHMMKRVDCGIYERQFEQAISLNKLKGGKDEKQ